MATHQKKAAENAAHIVFLDECGYMMRPLVKRTWALRGQTPTLHEVGGYRRKVSAIGALSISPRRHRIGQHVQLLPGRDVRSDALIDYLRDLFRTLRGPVILIWDNLNVHRSRVVRAFLKHYKRVAVEYLPPYAPQLNPVEALWSQSKYHQMCNLGSVTLDDLAAAARASLARIRVTPGLLQSFLHATPLRM